MSSLAGRVTAEAFERALRAYLADAGRRRRPGRGMAGARLHLVEGLSQVKAAAAAGCAQETVSEESAVIVRHLAPGELLPLPKKKRTRGRAECARCGRAFTRKDPRRRYCGTVCRQVARVAGLRRAAARGACEAKIPEPEARPGRVPVCWPDGAWKPTPPAVTAMPRGEMDRIVRGQWGRGR